MLRLRTILNFASAPVILILVAGCTLSRQRESAVALGSEPGRALQKLDMFVGKWEMAGEVRRKGVEEAQQLHGFNEAGWDEDGVFLVGRGSARVGDGPINYGLAAWTYDPAVQTYRFVLLDSSGATGIGTADFDEATRSLHARLTSEGPSGRLEMRASIHFVDANTKEEHWVAFDSEGQKVLEIQKTERRRE